MKLGRIFTSSLVLILTILFTTSPLVNAISVPQSNIFGRDVHWLDDEDTTACSNTTGTPGTLPALIPEPYNGAFTQAATKHNMSPSLIAAVFTEENFTAIDPSKIPERWKDFVVQHPDPNSGWPTNQFNTMGAFQFIPGTWAAYGEDGNGDGTIDAQNIFDSAAGAANYLSEDPGGATVDKTPPEWHDAIFRYNHAEWYVDAVLEYYDYYASGGTAGATTASSDFNCSDNALAGDCAQGGVAVTGKLAVLCEARKFDKFGYRLGGGHGIDPEDFMAQFMADGGYTQPFKQILDCSSIITMALWNVYHAKVQFVTDGMATNPQWFKPIPVSQTVPGDFVWRDGHVEIVAKAGAAATFGAHSSHYPPARQISDVSSGASYWSKGYVYVGPGATE